MRAERSASNLWVYTSSPSRLAGSLPRRRSFSLCCYGSGILPQLTRIYARARPRKLLLSMRIWKLFFFPSAPRTKQYCRDMHTQRALCDSCCDGASARPPPQHDMSQPGERTASRRLRDIIVGWGSPRYLTRRRCHPVQRGCLLLPSILIQRHCDDARLNRGYRAAW